MPRKPLQAVLIIALVPGTEHLVIIIQHTQEMGMLHAGVNPHKQFLLFCLFYFDASLKPVYASKVDGRLAP